MNSPSIFVRYDSGFIQIVSNFFLILMGVRRVHGCEKHGLPVPDDGVHVVSVSGVVDVIGEVVR